jgi:hypothetical protein
VDGEYPEVGVDVGVLVGVGVDVEVWVGVGVGPGPQADINVIRIRTKNGVATCHRPHCLVEIGHIPAKLNGTGVEADAERSH